MVLVIDGEAVAAAREAVERHVARGAHGRVGVLVLDVAAQLAGAGHDAEALERVVQQVGFQRKGQLGAVHLAAGAIERLDEGRDVLGHHAGRGRGGGEAGAADGGELVVDVAQQVLAERRTGDVAALALTCGSFRDQRPAAVGDIVRIAREHLSAKSASLREPKHPTLPKNDFTAQIQGMRQAFQGAAAPSQLADPVCNAFQTWSKLFEAMIQWTEIQEQQQSLYREESNILWWLFAEQSRDLRQPLAQLRSPAVALVASKEMADLTVTVPGPFSARAFLAKALRLAQKPSKDVTLAAAIAACPAEWNNAAVGHADFTKLDDLCPVSVALRKFVEVDGADTWTNAFKGATGLTATEKLDPVDLAEQAYEEWLLARACRKLYNNK